MSHDSYERFRQLLEEQGGFPLEFTHKFIGENSSEFAHSVRQFEAAHPRLRLQSRRESSGGRHVAYTYVLEARDTDEVVALFEATRLLAGIRLIL